MSTEAEKLQRAGARNGAPASAAPAAAASSPTRITDEELAEMKRLTRTAARLKADFDLAECQRVRFLIALEDKYNCDTPTGEGITLAGDVVRHNQPR